MEKNRKERQRLETKRDANEKYHAKIARDSAEKRQKEQARQDYHRLVRSKFILLSIFYRKGILKGIP